MPGVGEFQIKGPPFWIHLHQVQRGHVQIDRSEEGWTERVDGRGYAHSRRRSLTAVDTEPHGRPESESISSCGASFMLKGSALSLASSRAGVARA